jgi:hypothetical protein
MFRGTIMPIIRGLENIILLVAACGLWCLVFKLSVWCGAEGCVSGLRAAALKQEVWYGTEVVKKFRFRHHNVAVRIWSFNC